MDRLLYVAMTGAKQLMQAQTLVSHNLANLGTSGCGFEQQLEAAGVPYTTGRGPGQ